MTSALLADNDPAGRGGVIIVGGGHAASAVAAQLRQDAFDGPVVLVSSEQHVPYHRPPLSKKFLSEDCVQPLRPLEFYRQQGIDLRLSTEVNAIDRTAKKIVTATGALEYGTLVLATGAAPRLLTVPGAGLSGVFTLRTVEDAAALRAAASTMRRLVVIGGGYVGLEVAAELAERGRVAVTVLERESRILARVASPEFSAALSAYHRARGIEIRTGVDVRCLAGDASGRVQAVVAADGEIACDAVLVGIGAAPRDELARAAGIDCDGGILVDECARTSDPAIFAVGDATRRPLPGFAEPVRLESIPSATEQAKQAARAIVGGSSVAPEVPWFWSDQFDLKIKIAGIVRPTRPAVTRGDIEQGRFGLFHLDADDRVRAVETVNNPALFMAGRSLIAGGRSVNPALLSDSDSDIRTCFADH